MSERVIYECPFCQTEVDEDSTECPECGKSLVKDVESSNQYIVCPSCGRKLSPDSDGCPHCGFLFEKRSEKKTVVPPVIATILSFVIPLFLMIYVGLEFFVSLLTYPLTYPYQPVIYLTPFPFFIPTWLSALAFSFLIVLILFLLTLIGFDFRKDNQLVHIDKKYLAPAAVLSVIIILSLGLYIYYTEYYFGKFFSYLLLFSVILTAITQLDIVMEPKSFIEEPEYEHVEFEEERAVEPKRLVRKKIKEEIEEEIEKEEEPEEEKEEKEVEETAGEKEEVEEERPEEKILCPECGAEVPAGSDECPICEQDIEDVSEESWEDRTEKECPECGAIMPLGASKCNICGEPLKVETIECPNCGAKNVKGSTECEVCGEPLR